MKKFLFILLVLLFAVPAYALQAPDLEVGGHVRLRGYNFQNFWDFNSKNDYDNWSDFRLRSNIHVKADLGDNVSSFIQFANQNYGEGTSDAKDNTSNKVFVDNAYIDVNKFFGLPVNLRIGRQNLIYGTGFVLFDGQSQFASTSLYFDGVKLTWNITDKSKLDLIYVKDQEGVRGNNNNDDITLSGAYFTGHCPVIGGQQEVYVLNRDDQGFDNKDDSKLPAGAHSGKNIWMYGLRLSDKFDCGIDYDAEAAYQNGYYDKRKNIHQDALGYKLQAGYSIPVFENIKPRVFVGYTYLSGDESNTTDNEAWDVFYGGWPQFGDLLAWAYVNLPAAARPAGTTPVQYNRMSSTIGEAAYTNLSMPMIGVSAKCGKLSGKVSYTKLTFDETTGGVDDDFGDYYQLQAKYQYSKYLSFAGYAAMIDPGDAFAYHTNAAYECFWETRIDF